MHDSRTSAPAASSGIVVVGAGLAGPVAAIYLARRFGRVTVLERHTDPRHIPAGQGRSLMVILSDRGWRVLRELGLEKAVRRICVPLTARCGHLPDGNTVVTPYSRDGIPIWAVERHRLHRLLLDAAEAEPGVRVHFERPVLAVDLEAPALLVRAGTAERWITCQHVLGCDGVHSVVRAALVDQGAQEQVSILELAYQEIVLDLPSCDRGLMHYWPAGDALFGAFPLVSSPLFAGSVFLRREGPRPSYAAAAIGRALAQQFAEVFPALAAGIPDLEEQLATKPVSAVRLTRCDRWALGGTAVLVGDSCHAMAPFMGQGMNCAFEDVRTLVSCLDREQDWERAFAAYERIRKSDGNAIADISYQHYRTMSRLPDPRQEAEEAIARRLVSLMPDHFVPLYERCAFSEESYSSARAEERRLREVARRILSRHGSDAADLSDPQLRACVSSA
ncbi:FAD-dependent oxidoreductase [Streptantibioticus ferralitis]|uniref:NAD(P)/FAD-dependent oxidoreductase n=1 Tax=Streptantibioticus ferralitis TaxID=236510 RepID=A0ABT5ZBH8_9ACTN|nr:NAD(P)/FAD-dependent oxidoreductase [Streptantibioticus ferralitis]MDF2261184.1 NAD(P)/FAD-dependent oxidoreductase [Streptantibioticus ferralitis]